jgi:uncharacterized protein (TIGR02246 family)
VPSHAHRHRHHHPPTVADTTVDRADDLAALRSLIDDVEAGFNTKDAELMSQPFLRNGIAVGLTGAEVRCIDQMLEVSRAALSGFLRDQHARYELGEVTFLRPDVAIAHKRAYATAADGRPLDVGHAMVALYVFLKEGDRWWVAARPNTLVPVGS